MTIYLYVDRWTIFGVFVAIQNINSSFNFTKKQLNNSFKMFHYCGWSFIAKQKWDKTVNEVWYIAELKNLFNTVLLLFPLSMYASNVQCKSNNIEECLQIWNRCLLSSSHVMVVSMPQETRSELSVHIGDWCRTGWSPEHLWRHCAESLTSKVIWTWPSAHTSTEAPPPPPCSDCDPWPLPLKCLFHPVLCCVAGTGR